MNRLIDQSIQQHRTQIARIVEGLYELTLDIRHEELEKTVSDLRNRIDEPFMFVIVGEVKAGKSSFINALLATGEEICKVAPAPMTDTIQQIVYGDKEESVMVNDYIKRIRQPVDILQEIAIVDTPGTNTIAEHHQEITERFVPASDLIVFVFEAKNPYRQSAWDFFNFIQKEWQRKVVFVLQQKDLMPEEDLQVNINGVKEYANKKGIHSPLVFAVSAKDEIEGRTEQSGFQAVREFIFQNVTGGKAPILKLQNSIQTSRNINQRIRKGMDDRRRQWEADRQFREDIQESLSRQEQKSAKQVDVLVENLLAAYDRITLAKEKELNEGLSFFSLLRRSISALFDKKNDIKTWLNQLVGNMELEMNNSLQKKLNEGVIDIADSIQQMGKLIDLKIRSSQTILKDNHDIFSDIAERRANVLRDLHETFANFLDNTDNFIDEELLQSSSKLSPNLAAGSGIAVIGVILPALTNGLVFDITGGVLTAVGLLFAGVSVGLQKRKVMTGYQSETAKGRQRIEAEVSDKLKTYIQHIKKRIDNNFLSFDDLLEGEKKEIGRIEQLQTQLEQDLQGIESNLSDLI
ncbi:MAG: dynamin family protein [Bacteroidota bacterium]